MRPTDPEYRKWKLIFDERNDRIVVQMGDSDLNLGPRIVVGLQNLHRVSDREVNAGRADE